MSTITGLLSGDRLRLGDEEEEDEGDDGAAGLGSESLEPIPGYDGDADGDADGQGDGDSASDSSDEDVGSGGGGGVGGGHRASDGVAAEGRHEEGVPRCVLVAVVAFAQIEGTPALVAAVWQPFGVAACSAGPVAWVATAR